ncbi:MAG TPA: HAD hydrolase-like protein [Pyrinomonadaceae bacterium]|jgi:phosphoglycolate phosphatase-like HAD superfamily hydrolase|nr:HAD hydrolase-like protein [Pyrinomonadaceae bacterium]
MHDSKPHISLSEVRILLWDIDGTLMRSTVQGGYRKYFTATMKKVFGHPGNLDEIIPSGMTDTQIIFEALRGEGFRAEQIFERKAELLQVFQSEMKKVLAENGEPYETLQGVHQILTETAKNPRFINALLTGNLSVAAEIKLSAVGLWHYFENAPNAFGEISHDRSDLAVEAGNLFKARYEFDFSPEQFIVIGDTPNDIFCARAFGAKVVAVATGRNQSSKSLAEHKPDVLLDDLSDTQKVLRLLETV